jgi:hypothetical protein
VTVAPGSFGAFLRSLPVRLDRTTVLAYDGRPVAAPAAATIALDVGRGDLQQCADTVLRLHAEHLWAGGRAGEAQYVGNPGSIDQVIQVDHSPHTRDPTQKHRCRVDIPKQEEQHC